MDPLLDPKVRSKITKKSTYKMYMRFERVDKPITQH
jgi:hypothetical protein